MDKKRAEYHLNRGKEKHAESKIQLDNGDIEGGYKSSKQALYSFHQFNKYSQQQPPGVAS